MESSYGAVTDGSEPISITNHVFDLICDSTSSHSEHKSFLGEDYLGPCRVVEVEGKGRGLVATQKIQPGQLVIAAKALAIAYNNKAISDEKCLNNPKQKMTALFESILKLVQTSPEHKKKVLHLSAGGDYGHVSPDTEYVGSPSELNERVWRIVVLNGFEGKPIRLSSSLSIGTPASNDSDSSYGLWYLPSFLNHGCANANCHWSTFGNLMVMRSSRLIHEEEELLISYIDPHQPYKKRMELFQKHGFTCDCSLCECDRAEGKRLIRDRENLLSNFDTEIIQSDVEYNNVNLIKGFIERIKSSYKDKPQVTNLYLIKPLVQLSLAQYERRNWDSAAASFARVYEYCGHLAQFTLFRVSCVLTIIICFIRKCQHQGGLNANAKGFKETSKAWKDRLRQCLVIQYGQNMVDDKNRIVKILEGIRSSFVQEMRTEQLLDWLCSAN